MPEINWEEYSGIVNYLPHPVFSMLLKLRNKIVLVCTGNQNGKTAALTRMITFRLMGMCTIADHNIKPQDKFRVIRIGAEILPESPTAEVRNTVYPVLKAQLPSSMIIEDITSRRPVVSVKPLLGGKAAQVEFVGYGQTSQAMAGVQRQMILTDEVCPYDFYEESMPRLTASNGQFYAGCTPVDAGWMYTELYDRAKVHYRTKAVRAFLKKQYGQDYPMKETTDSKIDIAVIQSASDDNPMYQVLIDNKKKEIAEGIISIADFPYETVSEYLDSTYIYQDPDTVAMRRYGLFRQISGAVHKEFQWNTHVVPRAKYFPNGIPHSWTMARLIDYHMSVPWAITWMAMSPENEAFVFDELNPDPGSWTTLGICKEIVEKSLDYRFRMNLIDPLAAHKQTNTNTSCLEEMNRIFLEMRREGYGTGGFWEGWDTKGTTGEDKVRERLINARICGTPMNNLQKMDGKEKRLPCLWILDNCQQTALSLKNWKKEEWLDRDAIITKDPKDKRSSKWSHFNMCLEAAFKDNRFVSYQHEYRDDCFASSKQYFRGGR